MVHPRSTLTVYPQPQANSRSLRVKQLTQTLIILIQTEAVAVTSDPFNQRVEEKDGFI